MSSRNQRRLAQRRLSDLERERDAAQRRLLSIEAEQADNVAGAHADIERYVDSLAEEMKLDDARFDGTEDPRLFEAVASFGWHGATSPEHAKQLMLQEVARRSVSRTDLALLLSSVDHTAYVMYANLPDSLKDLHGEPFMQVALKRLKLEDFASDLVKDANWAQMRGRWVRMGWRGAATEAAFTDAFTREVVGRVLLIKDGQGDEIVEGGLCLRDTVIDEQMKRARPEMRAAMERAFKERLDREWGLLEPAAPLTGDARRVANEILDVLRPLPPGDRRELLHELQAELGGEPDAEGKCPFCGAFVSVRWGDPPADPGSVVHALPECEEFKSANGDDFVRAVVLAGRALPADDPSRVSGAISVAAAAFGRGRTDDQWRQAAAKVEAVVAPSDVPERAEFCSTVAGAKSPPYSDHALMRHGRELWELTYKLDLPDEAVRDKLMAATGDLRQRLSDAGAQQTWSVDVSVFAAKWAVHAFQRLQTSHTFAAALMCSDVSREVLSGIEEQWDALLVLVPNGMLVAGGFDFSRVLVARYAYGAWMGVLAPDGGGFRLLVDDAKSLPELLASDERDLVQDSPPQRCVLLAKRLVAGLLLNLQEPTTHRVRKVEARAKSLRREAEPEHRIVTVGAPIEIDCRPAVREYIERGVVEHKETGKRSRGMPTVQWMVRGHYRMQAHGPHHTLRRKQWIRPFWKGPEAALIQTRGKLVAPVAQAERTNS